MSDCGCRISFEKKAKKLAYDLDREGDGYDTFTTQAAWELFQFAWETRPKREVEQPVGIPFDSLSIPDSHKLAEEIMRFVDETEKHDFLDKDHLLRTIQDAVWLELECAKSYGVAEGWKRGSASKRESGDAARYRQALRCIASLDDDDAAILAKKVATQALNGIEGDVK